MPPIDAATLARLRVRAEPESPGVCVYCGGAPMLPDGGTTAAGYARGEGPEGRQYLMPAEFLNRMGPPIQQDDFSE